MMVKPSQAKHPAAEYSGRFGRRGVGDWRSWPGISFPFMIHLFALV